MPAFGILQRGGRVYIEIVPDCAKATLQATIGEGGPQERDSLRINGIESFGPFAKAGLMKLDGLPSSYLHLKKSEFRFNYRGQGLYAVLRKMLREKPLD